MERVPERDEHVEHVDTEREGHATTGGGAAAGAVTGGAIGAVAGGPVGAVVGAVGGAILGAVSERVMHGQPGHVHEEGDEAHWAGDHEHADDDQHDHRFHYDVGSTGRSSEEEAVHEHRYVNGRCTCGATDPGVPVLPIPPII